jgi:hypothetical protein
MRNVFQPLEYAEQLSPGPSTRFQDDSSSKPQQNNKKNRCYDTVERHFSSLREMAIAEKEKIWRKENNLHHSNV